MKILREFRLKPLICLRKVICRRMQFISVGKEIIKEIYNQFLITMSLLLVTILFILDKLGFLRINNSQMPVQLSLHKILKESQIHNPISSVFKHQRVPLISKTTVLLMETMNSNHWAHQVNQIPSITREEINQHIVNNNHWIKTKKVYKLSILQVDWWKTMEMKANLE